MKTDVTDGDDLEGDPGGSLPVQVEALVQADAPAGPGGSFPVARVGGGTL